tara:strand:- start:224 stop:493 length:270 start_codon:yes stop_codon:yes gene_type:complete
MEKFVVWGEYCKDALLKREPYRKDHLSRLANLKEMNILDTIGPTKCSRFLFAIFNANNENEVKQLIENDIYWEKGIWISFDIYPWIKAL